MQESWTPQDVWDVLHDGLLLPRSRLRRVSDRQAWEVHQLGQKAGRERFYTDTCNVQWVERATPAEIVSVVYDLAAYIAEHPPIAFGRLPQPTPFACWHLESSLSMVRARLLRANMGPYPFAPFEPFEVVFRLDVLMAPL